MLVQSQCSGRLDRAIDAGAVHVKVPATHTRLVEVVEEIHGDRVRTGRPVAFDLEGLRRASRLTGLRRLRSTDLHAVDADTGEGWVARFRFSFLSDVTGLYRFRRRGRKPTTATLDRVAQAIMANLPACRAAWWDTHGNQHEINMVNRRVETKRIEGGDGLLAKVALKPGRTAFAIVSAGYDSGNGTVALTLDDGRALTLTAGHHIEEAEEW